MKIKFILPALQEAKSPYWRPIKYSLFPPLGLATLASLCSNDDEIEIVDEHVEDINFDDEPDLVCIETYITNAYRAYEISDIYRQKGSFVVLGGLHATSLPHEAKQHADTVISGMGENSFPHFLSDFRSSKVKEFYNSAPVNLDDLPLPRRDLLKREKYLVPNSMVFSRGCPNKCSFCYVSSFYKGGKSFYAYKIERILQEIESLKGKHLYFLDDNLFADKRLCRDLFREMGGMGRLFQGAITVNSILEDDLINQAYEAGIRSAFIGFESINKKNLALANKHSNLNQDYISAIKKLDELGIMINGSFIFGLDDDTNDVFHNTTQWAIESGITTATFHILTPYPGTKLHSQMISQNRVLSSNWNDYDTRHLVFKHPNLSKEQMERGYNNAYKEFYRWTNIISGSRQHEKLKMQLKHLTYAGAWKKFEPVWNYVVKHQLFQQARKVLEYTLD
ncbi:MAG TPA: radical SAM protein [Pseudobacteroides sp.]|uniref:B12-binding domain-containing radical SAM protein n=1 Tax=Pseudobacteroides sp. TaxID=1968840 RepID=UPI002F93B109